MGYVDTLLQRLSTQPVVVDAAEEEKRLRDKISLCEQVEYQTRERISVIEKALEQNPGHVVLEAKRTAASRDLAEWQSARGGYLAQLFDLLHPAPPQAGSILDRLGAAEAELELQRLRAENAELRKRKGKASNGND